MMDYEEFLRDCAVEHARRFPNGCPGLCFACVARLQIPRVQCPVCDASSLYSNTGVVPAHPGKVRGRRGYSARHMRQFAPDCSGSGKPVRGARP